MCTITNLRQANCETCWQPADPEVIWTLTPALDDFSISISMLVLWCAESASGASDLTSQMLSFLFYLSFIYAEPYIKLGRQMSLPQTACLALPGPIGPVPGTPNGRAWYVEEDEEEPSPVTLLTHMTLSAL